MRRAYTVLGSLAALLLLAILFAHNPAASARAIPEAAVVEASSADQAHPYLVVGLSNQTDKRITYKFRWGSGVWKEWTIEPGERRWQAWTFNVPGTSAWPTPAIRYDIDGRTGYWTWLTRELRASPTYEKTYWSTTSRYAFVLRADGYTIDLIRMLDDPVRR
jgi:hypothetical protein